MDKKIVFSGVQPSGDLTIGNYIGAIKEFKKLQEEYNCIFSVVDMHSITVPQIPKNLRQRTYEILATYIASGIDPEKSVLFVQSHVPAHAELSWVLSTISYMGQLSRMTQYKEKSQRSDENLNAGLFTYPVLMAADILLYQTDLVPVGEDQRQHLELARDLAERFNYRYSPTFVVPKGLIPKETGKIYSLKEPNKKMSKSDEDLNASILLKDDRDTIIRKIRKAVTDSKAEFRYCEEQKGLQNLINIHSAFSGESVEDIVGHYKNSPYSAFKEDLGFLVADALDPFRHRFDDLMKNKKELDEIMKTGADKASYLAHKTLRKVYRKIGFVQPK
ncbi:MAG: tryptophan--tRNA ligase [Tissierellia bacterium]|nr:tryptophan--tRNA ligase [Tissierellia bacterium]